MNRLVYYEEFSDINQAIAREKEIKSIMRKQQSKLSEPINARWRGFERGVRSASPTIRDSSRGSHARE